MAHLIHHLLTESAACHPDQRAIIGRNESITYRELDERSTRLAHTLAGLGVGPGTPVGLAVEKSIDAICALYGVLKSGGAYVPIDPFSPASRAAAIVKNCQLAHVIASPGRIAKLLGPMLDPTGNDADACASLTHVLTPAAPTDDDRAGCHGRDVVAWDAGADAAPTRAPIDMDLAYILHTSGSTGVPKGVAITHRNALTFVDMCVDFFAVTASDRLCSHAPLHFDLSVFDLFVAAATGATVVIVPPFFSAFPKKLVAWIDEHQITVWNSVASALTLMVDRGKLADATLDSLRAVIFSGEVMPIRALRALRGPMPGAVFYNVYGQTEANSSMYYRVDEIPDDDSAKLPIGRAFPNFEIFALTGDGQVIDGPGAEGELYVRALSVAAGYYGAPDKTREKFIADPRDPVTGGVVYRTGDLVTRTESGDYVFVGRTDNLIKSRGYRVELGEIELVLLGYPGVERAAAVAVPDDAIGNRLHAFVSPQPGVTLDQAAILAACSDRLPSYMIPESLAIRDALPHTSTGKVDRKALRAELLDSTPAPA